MSEFSYPETRGPWQPLLRSAIEDRSDGLVALAHGREREQTAPSTARVSVLSRAELASCRRWTEAFADQRKDYRHYELVEDTLHPEFLHRYFVVMDGSGEPLAVQPFFVIDQDLLAGASGRLKALAGAVRRAWPRFMSLRTLMVGSVAGDGHLDGAHDGSRRTSARLLASAMLSEARRQNAQLVVLKEFSAKYREILDCFRDHAFTRLPSLPMTRLNIDYASFDDYLNRALSRVTRKNLRRKFRAAARAAPIEMSAMDDITPIVDEVYPLYLQVYERSKLQFEKLTPEYLCELGRRLSDRTRFFVWRQNGRVVAMSICMVQGDTIYDEYLGLDYSVALDLHLYHYTFRDVIAWAIANGYKWYCSSSLNYDPKLHLRCRLDPLDVYVRHTSRAINLILRIILPWLEPTRSDKNLKRFPNYAELWGHP